MASLSPGTVGVRSYAYLVGSDGDVDSGNDVYDSYGQADYWWLRSPYPYHNNLSWLVSPDGSVYYYDYVNSVYNSYGSPFGDDIAFMVFNDGYVYYKDNQTDYWEVNYSYDFSSYISIYSITPS